MFSTYKDAMEWVAAGQAAVGKKAFTATAEYKAAYPAIEALYRAENPAPRKRKPSVEMPIFGSSLLLAYNKAR